NALNSKRDPLELLACYPLERVAAMHVAGGIWEDGFYFDTHGHPIPDAVFELVARVLAVRGVPVIIERDSTSPRSGELAREIERLSVRPERGREAAASKDGTSGEPFDSGSASRIPRSGRPEGELAEMQAELARLLTCDEPSTAPLDARSLE